MATRASGTRSSTTCSTRTATGTTRRCARRTGGGDLTTWLAFSSWLLADAFEDARRRVLLGDRLGRELNDRQLHVAEWLARLARSDPDRRVKFADVHAAFPQVAKRTLKRDLKRLREADVVAMEGKAKGARYRWVGPPS